MAARDLHAAPPNTYQVEENLDDLAKATDAQQGALDADAVEELNQKILKAQKDAQDEQLRLRDKRISEGEGVHLGDPLKTSKSTPASLETKGDEKEPEPKDEPKDEGKKTSAK